MQALPPPFPLQIAKTVSTEMFDSVSLLQDSIQLSLTKAEKDNGSVYLQRVPAFAELPPTQGAMLVKATPPTCLQPLAQVSEARRGQCWSRQHRRPACSRYHRYARRLPTASRR